MPSDRVGGWVGGIANQPSREADRQAESWQQSAAQQRVLSTVCKRKRETQSQVLAAVCLFALQPLCS